VPFPEFQSAAVPASLNCQTLPNPATAATIGCNPGSIAPFPPALLVFTRVHEYGHVNQIINYPAVYYSMNVEHDADCYAAENLVLTDPAALHGAILAFLAVGNLGDTIHGTGFQRATLVINCAHTVNPLFADLNEIRSSALVASLNPFIPESVAPSQETGADSKSQALANGPKANSGDQLIDSQGVPPVCTAIDILVNSAQQRFWDASTSTGILRPTIQVALGGDCSVMAGRLKAKCVASSSKTEEVSTCLATTEWVKTCDDKKCSERVYSHPGDATDHPSVRISDLNHTIQIIAGHDNHVTSQQTVPPRVVPPSK
jgi:hypothetical protein